MVGSNVEVLIDVDRQPAWFECGTPYVKPPQTPEQLAASRAKFKAGAF